MNRNTACEMQYKIIKAGYAPKNELDIKSIEDKYNSIDFYFEAIIKSPYFIFLDEEIRLESDDLDAIFNLCISIEQMSPFIAYAQQFLSMNYISNQSVNCLQLYVRGIILEYLAHKTWNKNSAKNIVKAFICLYENLKKETPERINLEIRKMCNTIIQLLKGATNSPYVPAMKEAEEIISIVEMFANVYCIFPIDFLDEYFDELFSLLSNKQLLIVESKKVRDLSNFIEELQSNVFLSDYVDLTKFKAYPIESYPKSKIDSISINYINNTLQIAVINIYFIETTPCDIEFYITYYDKNKEKILLNCQKENDNTTICYQNHYSSNKCGMVMIQAIIFGWPKNTKFIRVALSENRFYSIEYELPEQ